MQTAKPAISLKALQALLITVVGSAAAIPGLAVARQFTLPAGTRPLFEFVIITVSTAVVLTAYVARERIAGWKSRTVVLAAPVGIALVMVAFLANMWITSRVLVEHDFDQTGTSQVVFFPLFITEEQAVKVAKAGGRRRYIETPPASPASVADMRTERNVALTVGVMLLSYAGLIGSVASLFALLGFHALPRAQEEDIQEGGGQKEEEDKPQSPT